MSTWRKLFGKRELREGTTSRTLARPVSTGCTRAGQEGRNDKNSERRLARHSRREPRLHHQRWRRIFRACACFCRTQRRFCSSELSACLSEGIGCCAPPLHRVRFLSYLKDKGRCEIYRLQGEDIVRTGPTVEARSKAKKHVEKVYHADQQGKNIPKVELAVFEFNAERGGF